MSMMTVRAESILIVWILAVMTTTAAAISLLDAHDLVFVVCPLKEYAKTQIVQSVRKYLFPLRKNPCQKI